MEVAEAPTGFPVFSGDLFDPDVLRDSKPTFAEIRALGDAVWCADLDMFLVGRFADVRAGLRAADTLVSGRGVMANRMQYGDGLRKGPTGVLTMDGEEHDYIKGLVMKPLTPVALQALKDYMEREAASVVERLADGQEFEAMSALASYLPVRIVADLIGLKEAGPERLLRWSEVAFDSFAPPENPRVLAVLPALQEFLTFVGSVTRETVTPGGWADSLFDAVDRGDISLDTARLMVIDYAIPSLDTTILATGEMLWRLATVDGAYEAIRQDPGLISPAVYESVRMATPIRGFTRYAVEDFAFSERVIPKGSRVFLINAAANLDERRYENPDRFDLTRNPRDNLAWGHGSHICAGMHLARMEMEALLGAMVRSVKSLGVGKPTRLVNNGLQGYDKLPLTLFPA